MPEKQSSISTEPPSTSAATHSAPPETIMMNKYHLMLAYKKVMDKPRAPNGALLFMPLVFAFGLVLTLLPADFEDYWGIDAATWQALVILFIIVSVIIFVWLLGHWAFCIWKYPQLTEEQFYEEICGQMQADRKKLTEFEQKYPLASQPTADTEGSRPR